MLPQGDIIISSGGKQVKHNSGIVLTLTSIRKLLIASDN